MSNPDPAFITSSISAAVAAILTIAQAVPSIDKRLARVSDIEREIGRMPSLIRRVYVWPQYAYKIILLGITFIGVLMVAAFMDSVVQPGVTLAAWVDALKGGGFWLVTIWLVVGASMYVNAFSWILIALLGLARPLRIVIGEHPYSQDPSWPALWTLIWLNDSAKPLVISAENAGQFADWLIRRASHDTTPNRAEPPHPPAAANPQSFRDRIGNALLAGCIIEGAHYLNADFPRQVWGRFYRAIGEMDAAADTFTPASIIQNWNNAAFYDHLQADLNKRLLQQAVEQAVPDAEQARQSALRAVQVATQALQNAVQANAQQTLAVLGQKLQDAQLKVQEAQQNLTVAQQRLQVWQAVPAARDAARVAREVLAAAQESAQLAPDDGDAQQSLQAAQNGAQQAEHNLQNAEQAARQAVTQNPPGNYAPIPNSLALTAALQAAFGGLAQRHQGRVSALDPRQDGLIQSRWDIIANELVAMRCFHSESMLTQFMKLACVWDIWPNLPLDDFNFPYAPTIAALLLDRGVIMAAEDVKAIAFDNPKDQQVARTAERLVIEDAIRAIEPKIDAYRAWLPPQSLAADGTLRRWWLNYEFDLRIWDYAARMNRGEEIANDPGLTRWKAGYGQIARMKPS